MLTNNDSGPNLYPYIQSLTTTATEFSIFSKSIDRYTNIHIIHALSIYLIFRRMEICSAEYLNDCKKSSRDTNGMRTLAQQSKAKRIKYIICECYSSIEAVDVDRYLRTFESLFKWIIVSPLSFRKIKIPILDEGGPRSREHSEISSTLLCLQHQRTSY